jgi:hypothetical protein
MELVSRTCACVQDAKSKKQEARRKQQEARSKKQERLRWVDNSKFCYILPINDLISKSHGENFLMSCSESRLGLPEVASPPPAKAGERRLKCVEATLGSEKHIFGPRGRVLVSCKLLSPLSRLQGARGTSHHRLELFGVPSELASP